LYPDGTAFVEQASTLIVNANGGLIALKVTVSVAQTLSLKNANTGNEVRKQSAMTTPDYPG